MSAARTTKGTFGKSGVRGKGVNNVYVALRLTMASLMFITVSLKLSTGPQGGRTPRSSPALNCIEITR